MHKKSNKPPKFYVRKIKVDCQNGHIKILMAYDTDPWTPESELLRLAADFCEFHSIGVKDMTVL